VPGTIATTYYRSWRIDLPPSGLLLFAGGTSHALAPPPTIAGPHQAWPRTLLHPLHCDSGRKANIELRRQRGKYLYGGTNTMSTYLEYFAARVSHEPDFLGYRLRQSAQRHGWTDANLADALGCSLAALTDLRLCRVTRHREDVETIAARCGCDVASLAVVSVARTRRDDAWQVLQERGEQSQPSAAATGEWAAQPRIRSLPRATHPTASAPCRLPRSPRRSGVAYRAGGLMGMASRCGCTW
jgi:hypothetical protein